ncbi:hypothetical protein ACM26V_16930 [Salipaludibacillus sp. HK11]|uniref:hypothetical protein n=1 Tax=Salipaludibacillus sp. HK11 TaxID=3394320 RepID=UPI0039FD44D8
MNMKEMIKNYQENQDREIIDKILNLVDKDLLHFKYDGGEPIDVNGIVYVAYRIRAKIMQHCFKARNQKNIYEASQKDREDYNGLFCEEGDSWVSDLSDNLWLGVDTDELKAYNFKSVFENEKKLREYYGSQADDLFHLCKKFTKLNKDSDEFKQDLKESRDELLPLFIKGLEHALVRVDAERNKKEIVKYINIAMLTKYIEYQMELNGTKRIVKGDTSIYLKPKFSEDSENQAWMVILDKSLKFIKDEWFEVELTKNQKTFLKELHKIVRTEIENENVNAFWWNADSTPKLNKIEMAKRMNMKESNLKNTLKRIKDKVHADWDQTWNEYKNIG